MLTTITKEKNSNIIFFWGGGVRRHRETDIEDFKLYLITQEKENIKIHEYNVYNINIKYLFYQNCCKHKCKKVKLCKDSK